MRAYERPSAEKSRAGLKLSVVLLRFVLYGKMLKLPLYRLLIIFSLVFFYIETGRAESQTPLKDSPPALGSPSDRGQVFSQPWVIRKIKLGDVSFYIKGGSEPDTAVRFSPDGQLIAIGTYLGRLKLLEVYSGKIILQKQINEGLIKNIDFSPDGQTLYLGEQSIDAFITAVDVKSGKELWRFRMADHLKKGSSLSQNRLWNIYKQPGCYRLKVLDNGDILALGVHSWGDYKEPRKIKRLSGVYLLSPQGRLKWSFPKEKSTPMSLIYMDADPQGRRIAALAESKGANAPENYKYHPGSLYVLDGKNGSTVGFHRFKPLTPYFNKVSFWRSVSVGAKGKWAAVGMLDGRSFIFDLDKAKPRKIFNYGAPIMIGDLPVCAGAIYTHLAADGSVYFQTGNSNVPQLNDGQYVAAPPGPHPNANTINALDINGKVKWRFKSGHVYRNFWSDAKGRRLLTIIKKETPENGLEAGAILFDTQRPGGGSSKVVFYYHVKGLSLFQADMARDGSAFAVIEIPYQDPRTEKLIGDYQAHIVR